MKIELEAIFDGKTVLIHLYDDNREEDIITYETPNTFLAVEFFMQLIKIVDYLNKREDK